MLDLRGFTTWSLWISFMLSGAFGLITVKQPPVVTALLGQDAVLPCEFQTSLDEKIEGTPVLYWSNEEKDLLLDSEKYAGRVHRLDQNTNSLNKSVVLKRVQWSDSKKYECKLSVTSHGKSFRKKGNLTELTIYDSMTFDPCSHNDSLLCCEVNVTHKSSFVLSVTQNGLNLQTVESNDEDDLDQKTTRLSRTVRLQNPGYGNYECELRLGKHLITKSIFQIHLPADSGQNPEPWVLYTSLILVQTLILLVLLIVTVKSRYI